jgi:hypothetical protein
MLFRKSFSIRSVFVFAQHIDQSTMVASFNGKFLVRQVPLLPRRLCFAFGKHRVQRQHARQRQHVLNAIHRLAALVFDAVVAVAAVDAVALVVPAFPLFGLLHGFHRRHQHACHFGGARKVRHAVPHLGQDAVLVQGTQRKEAVQSMEQHFHGRGRQIWKMQNVIHTQSFDLQYDFRQIGPFNLGHRGGDQEIVVRFQSAQTIAFATAGSASTTGPLHGTRFGNAFGN